MTMYEHHIKNSQDFVNKIKDKRIEEVETIASYDVSVLFTCVPPALTKLAHCHCVLFFGNGSEHVQFDF